jgi:hypothetical protein
MPLTHNFVSGKPDSSDSSLVNPSNWNDNHSLVSQYTTATDGQTVFNTAFSSVLWVFLNGLKQRAGATYDYTASGGVVTFNTGLTAGDVVEIL